MIKKLLLFLPIFIVLLSACTKKIYVPVTSETVRIDTIFQTREVIRVDTFATESQATRIIIDSVAPVYDDDGNLLRLDRFRSETVSTNSDRFRTQLLQKTDSLLRSRADSVAKMSIAPVTDQPDHSRDSKIPVGPVLFLLLVICLSLYIIKKYKKV